MESFNLVAGTPINPRRMGGLSLPSGLVGGRRGGLSGLGLPIGPLVSIGSGIVGKVGSFFGWVGGLFGSDTKFYDPILAETWNQIHATTAELIRLRNNGSLTREAFAEGVQLLRDIVDAFRDVAASIEPPSDTGRGARDAADMDNAVENWITDRASWWQTLPAQGQPTTSQQPYQTAGFPGTGGGEVMPLILAGAAMLLLPRFLK